MFYLLRTSALKNGRDGSWPVNPRSLEKRLGELPDTPDPDLPEPEPDPEWAPTLCGLKGELPGGRAIGGLVWIGWDPLTWLIEEEEGE